MATTTLKTRIQHKFDTYENWSANDSVILEGEQVFASVTVAQDGEVNTVPAVLSKVGDGVHKFSELDWLFSKASDLYPWAKAATKPTYTAAEIEGLDSFIAGEINDGNELYRLVKVDDYNYKLQSKDVADGDDAWADVTDSNITIPQYDDTALADRVTANEEDIVALEIEVTKKVNDADLAAIAKTGIASLPQNHSVAVYEAVVAAQLFASAQKDGALTFSCNGDVPQIDIPILVTLLG